MKSLYESILSSTGSGRAAFPNGAYKIGDILVTVFSYTMTIPSFYQVVGLKGKTTIIVKELAKRAVDGNGWQGKEIPEKDNFIKGAKEIPVRIIKGWPKIDKLIARKWDGNPVAYDHLD